MKEFKRVNNIPDWKPALLDMYGDKEYGDFTNFCKSREKNYEIMYCLIRERKNIIYCSKKLEEIEARGVEAFDINEFSRVVDKATKKFRLGEFSKMLEAEDGDHKAIQYGIREIETMLGDKEYFPTALITMSFYSEEEWLKISSFFYALEEKEKRYQLDVVPATLSYLDSEGYYITILVTDMKQRYDRVVGE